MKYIIKTRNASQLRCNIINCVSNQQDAIDHDIRTWNVVKTQSKSNVLVHTTEQWEDVGCLSLVPNERNTELKVEFRYWSNYVLENRTGTEHLYLFGRFTELILVHFKSLITGISIE